jgi:hypothetical protein
MVASLVCKTSSPKMILLVIMVIDMCTCAHTLPCAHACMFLTHINFTFVSLWIFSSIFVQAQIALEVDMTLISHALRLSVTFWSSMFQILGCRVILIVTFYSTGLALKLHIVRTWRSSGVCGVTSSVRGMTRQQPCGLSTFSGRGL